MKVKSILFFLAYLLSSNSNAGDLSAGYDVIVLAGQSNMAGRGMVFSPIDDAGTPDPENIKMWDPNNGIVAAKDPLIHPEIGVKPTGVGMAMSFANAYLERRRATGFPNRRVLLVGAAWGGTSFIVDDGALHRRWIATDDATIGGDLYREAVKRSNNALAAAKSADASSTFVAILWHQGESDLTNGGASSYATSHTALMKAFRSHIVGAQSAPIVVGEMTPCFWAQCNTAVRQGNGQAIPSSDLEQFRNYIHNIENSLPRAGWVSSVGLKANPDYIHFDTASQRELGRRYFSKLWEVINGVPSPDFDLASFNLKIFNVGKSIDFDPSFNADGKSAREDGNLQLQGVVKADFDPVFGNVVSIDSSKGQLNTQLDGALLNGSYTKMAWIKLNSDLYRHHMLSADNPSQAHYFYFSQKRLSAGHSSASQATNIYVGNPALLPLNEWAHVATTYDAQTRSMVLYVNGTMVDSASDVPPATSSSGSVSLNLSGFGSRPGFGLDGSMTAARIYKQALSGNLIKQLADFERVSATGYGRHLKQ